MSNAEFQKKMALLLKTFEKQMKTMDEFEVKDLRKSYREEKGVIYVKEYTVKAHMRPVRPRAQAMTRKGGLVSRAA